MKLLFSRLKSVTRSLPETKTSAAGSLVALNYIGKAKWTPRRYDMIAEEGYRKNVVAYRCIAMIAAAAAHIPWLAYDSKGREIISHQILDLLAKPNPTTASSACFIEQLISSYLISGNIYVEAVRPRDGGAPHELFALRADRMRVVPGAAGLPQAYEYHVDGQITRWNADPISGASDILHIKHYNPRDDWYGLAPLEAALLAVDQHNAAGAWNQAMLNNGARPSGALVYAPKSGSAHLTEEQIDRLKEQLDSHYQGARNAARPMVLEGGLEWRAMSLSPNEMDWLRGRDSAARDIALAFGVPSQLIGLPDAQTYSNQQEARLAFYEETIIPLAQKLAASFSLWLMQMTEEELTLVPDLDAISALTLRRESLWEKLNKADFLTLNEKREAAGYAPLADGNRL